MITQLRNLAIALGASIIALFVGAGLQELFVRLVPASRTFLLGSIDIGSWIGFATVFVSFALAGIVQTRLLHSNAVLMWVLLGPLVFLVAALLQGLNVSGCLRRWTTLSYMSQVSCGMITAILLLPLLGALSGWLVLLAWRRLNARGEVAV
jgi:predicted membrane-bound spermidine synthase